MCSFNQVFHRTPNEDMGRTAEPDKNVGSDITLGSLANSVQNWETCGNLLPEVLMRPRRHPSTSPSRVVSMLNWSKSFKRQGLGDKLQELAKRSPRHVVAIELLVDQILTKLDVAVLLTWSIYLVI